MITARAAGRGQPQDAAARRASAPEETPRSLQLYGVDPALRRRGGAAPGRRGPRRPHRHELRLPGAQGDEQGRRRGDPAQAAPAARHRARGGASARARCRSRSSSASASTTRYLTFLDAGRIGAGGGLRGGGAARAHGGAALRRRGALGRDRASSSSAVTRIPVLGNGDIWEAEDALRMMRTTGCDGVDRRPRLPRPALAVPRPRRRVRGPRAARTRRASAAWSTSCSSTRACSPPGGAKRRRCARSASTRPGTRRAFAQRRAARAADAGATLAELESRGRGRSIAASPSRRRRCACRAARPRARRRSRCPTATSTTSTTRRRPAAKPRTHSPAAEPVLSGRSGAGTFGLALSDNWARIAGEPAGIRRPGGIDDAIPANVDDGRTMAMGAVRGARGRCDLHQSVDRPDHPARIDTSGKSAPATNVLTRPGLSDDDGDESSVRRAGSRPAPRIAPARPFGAGAGSPGLRAARRPGSAVHAAATAACSTAAAATATDAPTPGRGSAAGTRAAAACATATSARRTGSR